MVVCRVVGVTRDILIEKMVFRINKKRVVVAVKDKQTVFYIYRYARFERIKELAEKNQ